MYGYDIFYSSFFHWKINVRFRGQNKPFTLVYYHRFTQTPNEVLYGPDIPILSVLAFIFQKECTVSFI